MSLTPRSRILAVDFGDSRTGLAGTDWTGAITVPLPRIDSRDPEHVVAQIVALCAERDAQAIVVGMPLTVDGTVGERAEKTGEFVARLGSWQEEHPAQRHQGLKKRMVSKDATRRT